MKAEEDDAGRALDWLTVTASCAICGHPQTSVFPSECTRLQCSACFAMHPVPLGAVAYVL